MILVIDSGAGGKAVNDSLIEKGIDSTLYPDTSYFPYGNKSPEFLARRIEDIISQHDNVSLAVVACNTASLCYTQTCHKLLRIVPTPEPGDIILGSRLTSYRVNGTDASDLIEAIQLLYLGLLSESDLDKAILKCLEDIDSSSVYLGCTHFSYVKKRMEVLRPDLLFREPNYASLVQEALTTL